MASFALTNPLPLVRSYSSDCMVLAVCNTFQLSNVRLKNWCVLAISKKKAPHLDQQDSSFKESGENVPKNIEQTRPNRKKLTEEGPDHSSADMIFSFEEEKIQASTSLSPEEGNSKRKVTKKKPRKNTVSSEDQSMRIELADAKEMMTSGGSVEDDKEEYKIRLKDYEEDVSDSTALIPEEGNTERKVTMKKTRKKAISSEDKSMRIELADAKEMMTSGGSFDDDKEEYMIRLKDYEEEDNVSASTSLSPEEGNTERKVTKKKPRKKAVSSEEQSVRIELAAAKEMMTSGDSVEDDEEYKIRDYEEKDISFTYGWPPLVCCFGAAQHLFIPSGRLANRMIDHEIHESKKDMLWTPTKFVRAPGGSPSSVAIAHASIGGRVAFMGKLGDDEYGETILYHLNVNKVQTRAIVIDSSRTTALSQMKISKRGGLKATVVKPCAEDSFLSSEINIDVLKEVKMFYFNSSSLLGQSTRSTTMEAIRISKKYGGVIFFDLNLPLPLWKSSTETNIFIQKAWNTADIIEVTKQELEFLCGIESAEKFDTKDNDKSKFTHHKHEMVKQLWHSNLKVLFVTNGTSKIHYYTLNDNGFVRGMEDAPITPYTCDMSVSGDALVAALMRMLTVQPHLITNKGYLEHMIKYAINCAVIDQWLLARILGFPPKEEADPSSQTESRFLSISEKEYRTVEKAIT